jgi:hypothetical protein
MAEFDHVFDGANDACKCCFKNYDKIILNTPSCILATVKISNSLKLYFVRYSQHKLTYFVVSQNWFSSFMHSKLYDTIWENYDLIMKNTLLS